MKKVVSTILFIMVLLVGCSSPQVLRVPDSSNNIVGSHYLDIVSNLEKAGFSDIDVEIIDDLTSESEMKDGTIESILINDVDTFEKDHAFPVDSKVKILCHIIPKLKMPFSSDEAKMMDTDEVIKKLEEIGFTNISTEEIYDIDPEQSNDKFYNELKIIENTSFKIGDEIPFDGNIMIITHYPFELYEALIHIDFVSNFIFSKYGVDVYIDDKKVENLKHGEDKDIITTLKEGTHTIKFYKEGDKSVDGEVLLELSSNVEAEYMISCHSDYIEVEKTYVDYKNELNDDETKLTKNASAYRFKNYKDVITELKSLGFTNIKEEIKYDIVLGWTDEGEVSGVSINGRDDFNRGDVFKKDTPIVVTYHMKKEDDPNKIVVESTPNTNSSSGMSNNASTSTASSSNTSIPEEPKRAAVVAMTNYYAMDIFTADGNGYDLSKFHSYDDESGDKSKYYMTVVKWGKWTEVADNKWHVEGFRVKSQQFSGRNISLDVTFDGTNYVISNVKDLEGTNDSNRIIFESNDPTYIVTLEMVKNDRKSSSSSNKTSSSLKKTDIKEYVELLNTFVKQYETENSKYEVRRFAGTVYANNITTGIKELQRSAIAGNQQALESWDRLIASSTELSEALRKDMDSRGLTSYDIAIDILDDTNTEMVLAEIRNGEVIFDGVYGIDKR